MRKYIGVLLGLFVLLDGGAYGQEKSATRYSIASDLKTYPQGTAKETLASVLKAIESKRVDYLTAQLADPAFVDDRVKRLYGGRFEEQVEDTRGRLDSRTVRALAALPQGRRLARGQGSRHRATQRQRTEVVLQEG